MREMTGSWLTGPASADPGPGDGWRGKGFGLPESGPGSAAGLGRRAAGLAVDWLLAYALVLIVLGVTGTDLVGGGPVGVVASWAVPVLWAIAGTVCVALFAQTPGQAVLGMGTARVDAQRRVGWWRAAVRPVLVLLLLPPLIQDRDGRGIHDRVTGTMLIRTR